MNETLIKPASSPRSNSFTKGLQFEKYVIKMFNEDNFKVLKHREAKLVDRKMLTADCAYPDLEMIFGRYSKHKFAVECKWRQRFNNGTINLGGDSQLYSYNKFEGIFHIPVFLVIGVGGFPSNPDRVYVTPLRNFHQLTRIYETDLIKYKKRIGSRLFFNPAQTSLF